MRIFAFFIIIILLLLSLLLCHLSLRRPEMVNSLELGERSGPKAILSLSVLAGPLSQRGARASFPKVWESVICKPNFSFFRVIQRNLRKLDTQYCVRTRNTQMLLQRALAPERVCPLASSVFPSDRCQQDTFHFQPEVWTLAIYRGTSYLS